MLGLVSLALQQCFPIQILLIFQSPLLINNFVLTRDVLEAFGETEVVVNERESGDTTSACNGNKLIKYIFKIKCSTNNLNPIQKLHISSPMPRKNESYIHINRDVLLQWIQKTQLRLQQQQQQLQQLLKIQNQQVHCEPCCPAKGD